MPGVLRSPTAAAWAAIIVAFALYALIAFDQGQLLSVADGASALDTNYVHELVHDARHSAGFPCH